MTECLTYNISVTPAHARFGLANPKHLPDLAIRQERRTEKHLPDLPIRQEQEVGRLFGHGYSAVLVPKG